MANSNLTALDIYTQGYGYGRKFNSREFFGALKQAITTELENYGFCTLLDKILEERWDAMNMVAASVITEIQDQYNGEPLPSERDYYIPYVLDDRGEKVRWEELNHFTADSTSIIPKVVERTRYIRGVGRAIHKEQIDNRNGGVGGYVQSLIGGGQAQRDAEKIKKDAESAAEATRSQAATSAEATRRQAEEEAKRIKENAEAEAEAIKAAAQQTAEKTAQEKARESADSLVKRYLQEAQKQTAQECSEDAAQAAKEYLERAKSADAIHEQMCDELGKYQVAWAKFIDEMSRQLKESKAEFYTHQNKWRTSLAPRDWMPLAERYIELYKIINNNMHKQIANEAALRYAQQAETPEEREKADEQDPVGTVESVFSDTDGAAAPAAALEDGIKPRTGTLEVLQELDRIFTKALNRFRITLEGLGLIVYFPQAGEEFDEVLHICEDMGNDPTGKKIVRCILPGVTKQYNDNESIVLVRAEVEIEA
ncbi:MAG: hypothetical protein LUD84_02800 [Clostridiales bacterium]|nr:hypothetical protein [Clostridiales bacterium]